ncbi:MAG: hypothetical protein AAF492_14950, partial [Verrucomicrobiota bacterium]
RSGQIKLWEVASGAELLSLDVSSETKDQKQLRWSPDGRILIGSLDRGEIWDASKGFDYAGGEAFAHDYTLIHRKLFGYTPLEQEDADEERAAALQGLGLLPRFGEPARQLADVAQQAVFRHPENADTYVTLGLAQGMEQHWGHASDNFKKAEALNAGQLGREGYAGLAWASFERGRPTDGEAAVAEARKQPENQRGQRLLQLALYTRDKRSRDKAGLFIESGEHAAALELLERELDDEELSEATQSLLEKKVSIDYHAWVHHLHRCRTTGRDPYLDTLSRYLKKQSPEDFYAREMLDRFHLAHHGPIAYQIENLNARALTAAILQQDRERANEILTSSPEAGLEAGFFFASRTNRPAARRCLSAYSNVDPTNLWITDALRSLQPENEEQGQTMNR